MNLKKEILLLLTVCFMSNALSGGTPSGRETSQTYSVKVNGNEVWTERVRSTFDPQAQPDWFKKAPQVAVKQEIHIADFEVSSKMEIQIEVGEAISRAAVKPLSRGIQPKFEGNSLTFTVDSPDKLYLEINDLPPLALFGNRPLSEPDPSGATYSFGPGIHRAGILTLKDNESVYIAPGALVYGGIRARGATNIRIFGGGVLDGNAEIERMVLIEDSKDIRFEGITIRNGQNWLNTLIRCDGIIYRGVKLISFGPGGDGVDPLNSSNVEISDCFFRCTDDCIAIKAPDRKVSSKNIRIFNNTMVGYAFSDGVTIGFELNGPEISNIEVWNCDILYANGGSRVEGHSGFSIICDGPALVKDVVFRDLRVEQVEFKLFEAQCTNGTLYGKDPPGRIENVTVRNVSWNMEAPIILRGFGPENLVKNIRFENCTVAGKPLIENLRIIQAGPFLTDLQIKQDI